MVGRRFNLHGKNAPGGLNLLQQGVVILQEELQELCLMAPLALVVVLDGVRLVGANLRRRALCCQRCGQQRSGKDNGGDNENNEKNPAHGTSLIESIVPSTPGCSPGQLFPIPCSLSSHQCR